MCAGPFKPSIPSPPPPPPEEESVKQQRLRMRKQEEAQRTANKQEAFEDRVAAYSGKVGRRSLLTGRRGGEGFELSSSLMSKDTLGA
jgi:hypothetical protein